MTPDELEAVATKVADDLKRHMSGLIAAKAADIEAQTMNQLLLANQRIDDLVQRVAAVEKKCSPPV